MNDRNMLIYKVNAVRENGQQNEKLITPRQLDHMLNTSGIANTINRAKIDELLKTHGVVNLKTSTPGGQAQLEIRHNKLTLMGYIGAMLRMVATYVQPKA